MSVRRRLLAAERQASNAEAAGVAHRVMEALTQIEAKVAEASTALEDRKTQADNMVTFMREERSALTDTLSEVFAGVDGFNRLCT